MSDNYEYMTTEPVYNVPDVAISLFYEIIRQEMKSLWYTTPDDRRAMIHECFNWAKDFCDEVKKWEDEKDETE